MIQLGNILLFDNSSLSTWRERGPRYWYFEQYRGWRRDYTNVSGQPRYSIEPTEAGHIWHAMMDTLWSRPDEGWEGAWETFEHEWYARQVAGGFPLGELDPAFEADLQPYAPSTMQETLIAYEQERRDLLRSVELLACEQPFIVPLDPNDPTLFFIGRKDKRVRHQQRIKIVDHKSTTRYRVRPLGRPHLAPEWRAQFYTSLQGRGYLYAEKLEHQLDRCTILFDGTLFYHSTTYTNPITSDFFCLEPIECQLASLDLWLWATHFWVKDIRRHIEAVEELRDKGTAEGLPYLPAFPCTGCTGFCPYADLCMSRDNPESWLPDEDPPDGFIESKWSPFDLETVQHLLGKNKEPAR